MSPLVKLPIGAVEPRGWLMGQLELMRDGFTGRLSELSRFLGDDSGWITLKGKGWEEMPYWLKGYGDLGYLLKDPPCARRPSAGSSRPSSPRRRTAILARPTTEALTIFGRTWSCFRALQSYL